MTALIELKSVSKSFGRHTIIDNVSFKLNIGEITTLIGQNGSGKTTLAKLILGQETCDSGTIIVKPNIKIGYIPQSLDTHFNMPITSEKFLQILAPNGIDHNLFDLQKFINYNIIKNTDISHISGGELQKLLIAGTLMNKPDLLILDEPIQFLDVVSQQEFYYILKDIKDKFKLTIFMISHDLFTVMKNSDRVICLNKHICCSGKPTDINSNTDFKNSLSAIGVYIHNHDHDH